ncbi:hypothetical protein FKM82_022242 [Ascaphus truei]
MLYILVQLCYAFCNTRADYNNISVADTSVSKRWFHSIAKVLSKLFTFFLISFISFLFLSLLNRSYDNNKRCNHVLLADKAYIPYATRALLNGTGKLQQANCAGIPR